MATEALSVQLRRQYDDLLELYNEAKLNDNPAQMEKLSKMTTTMAKQIKEHEEHEKVTIRREDVQKLTLQISMCIGKSLKRYLDDKERAVLVLEQITEDVLELVAAYDGD